MDTNNNGTGDAADEVVSESWSDGAGRVRRSRSVHTLEFTMRSSTHVYLNKLANFCDVLLIAGGAILLMNFISWSSSSYGFNIGYELGIEAASLNVPLQSPSNWHLSDAGNTYESLSGDYFNLCIWSAAVLCLSILSILIRMPDMQRVFKVLCVFALSVICWKLNWMLGLKDPSMNESLDASYNALFKGSSIYDMYMLTLSAALIVLNLLSVSFRIMQQRWNDVFAG